MLEGTHEVEDIVYVDANMANAKCWGNHPTFMVDSEGQRTENEQSSNLNLWFGPKRDQDFKNKSHLSTTLHMLSFYGFNLDKLCEDAIGVILKLDGVSDTFYKDNIEWIEKDSRFLSEILGYKELVYFLRWHNKKYFSELERAYRIHMRIYCESPSYKLETHIDLEKLAPLFEPIGLRLELPKGYLKPIRTFDFVTTKTLYGKKMKKEEIFSNCWSTRNCVWSSVQKAVHI